MRVLQVKDIKKAHQVIRKFGFTEFKRRFQAKINYRPAYRYRQYQTYLRLNQLTEKELSKQRETHFAYRPCFGIVIPLYNTKLEYLHELLESFEDQTYTNYKLFMVDASPAKDGKTALTDVIQSSTNPRITYHVLEKNYGISGNTNQAIRLAMQDETVDYIALCDHDDYIEPNTLFECAKVLNQDKNIKIIYSDEDVVRYKGDPEASYVMKPDFNPYLIESLNYINHFFVCEKNFLEQIKTKDDLYERPEYDGAQDYDLYLRLLEKASQLDVGLQKQATQQIKDAIYTSSTIYHIPKVLYHWRAAENSTAQDPHNKLYAYDAGKRALEDHFKRLKVSILSVEHTNTIGTYRVRYDLQQKPLVSVIISGANHANSERLINSIKNGTYPNLEYITVGKSVANINGGAKKANGDVLLFLDSDLEMLDPNSISEMVAILQRNQVGVVGAELLFPNGKIQHAGIVVGLDSNAGHIFYRRHLDFTYNNRANCTSNYSAVTVSCLMVDRNTYREVGGFDEGLEEQSSGIDFCLKIRALGELVVYTPYAKFRYHSKKDGITAIATGNEAERLRDKWPAIYQKGDPYYSHNFSLSSCDCYLRED